MNFMISLVGWFLWNWAEFSVTKEKGDGDIYLARISGIVNGSDASETTKATLIHKIHTILGSPVSLKDYMKGHYETWVGSLLCIVILLWIMSRQISLDPFATIAGTGVELGWNDLYLLGAGAVWDAFIFGFRWVRNFFKKKTEQL